jgi:hypothetical protein
MYVLDYMASLSRQRKSSFAEQRLGVPWSPTRTQDGVVVCVYGISKGGAEDVEQEWWEL